MALAADDLLRKYGPLAYLKPVHVLRLKIKAERESKHAIFKKKTFNWRRLCSPVHAT